MIGTSANNGKHAMSMMGISRVCVSLMSDAAAPTAMNKEPKISRDSTSMGRNQATVPSGNS